MTLVKLFSLKLDYLERISIGVEDLLQNHPSEFEYAGYILGISDIQDSMQRVCKVQQAPKEFRTFYIGAGINMQQIVAKLAGNEPWLVWSTGKRITGHTDKSGDTMIVPLIFVKQIICHEVQEAQDG